MKPTASFKGQQRLRLGRFSQSGGIYHVISSTHQRSPLFLDFVLAQTAIRAFTDMRLLKQNQLLCWVLMPDHVHWLVQLDQQSNLSKLIGVMKSASARQIRQKGYALKVWGDGFYDRALRRNDDVRQVARYIVANPLRANMVTQINDYPYWNAVWL